MIWLLACFEVTDLHPVEWGEVKDVDQDGWDTNSDCDDRDRDVHPGATEVWYDGVDQDCDWNDDDQDFDGVPRAQDCDDEDPAIGPHAQEVWYDGVDQDCDGNDDDQDLDGYAYRPGTGGGDCNDLDPEVSPAADEVWYDGVDQDCDGNDTDQDGDGYLPIALGGIDCDDEDREMPGWRFADGDGDGHGVGEAQWVCDAPEAWARRDGDCDDEDPAVHPWAAEVCDDFIDNDCSGDANDCAYDDRWSGSLATIDTATLEPAASGGYFGYGLASADLDADGIDDLAVSAFKAGDDDQGQVIVSYGPVTGAQSAWDQAHDGGVASLRAGRTMATAGDTDFDGYEEIWVGLPYADVDGNDDGGVVLLGMDSSGDLMDADVALWGSGNTDRLGWGLASVDLDGDGFPDLLAGASLDSRVEVVFGPHEGLLEADETWVGAGGFGTTVVASPDTDGDGLSEVFVGAPDAGEVTLLSLDDELATLVLGDDAGASIAVADIDGDGVLDVAVGSPDTHTVHLVHGPLAGTLQVDETVTHADSRLGQALVACDLDGDGAIEVAVGGPGMLGGTDYAVVGTLAPLTLWSESVRGATAGAALTCGDLDGDGFDDLAVGAPYGDLVRVLPGGGA